MRERDARFPPSGKETGIGRDSTSPIAAIGVLSLGLILPIGAGPLTDRAVSLLASSAETQTKSVTLVEDGQAEQLRTRAATVADLFLEQNIQRNPEDQLDVDPTSPVVDGETIHYRAALPVTLVVDDVPQMLRTTAADVAAVLDEQHVAYDRHDSVVPAPGTPVAADLTIHVDHVNSWVESVRVPVPPPVRHLGSIDLPLGSIKVLQKGAPGLREVSYVVTRQADRTEAPRRSWLASRILRAPRARVVAAGIGEYTALADLARRGFVGTIRLARAAISMIATAYTRNCYGCSGVTASGKPAGHGIVAVDPRVIPLGSHLFIPGYGHATAGDTGGAIQGHRIDLGFNNYSDALHFGRRSIVVYVMR